MGWFVEKKEKLPQSRVRSLVVKAFGGVWSVQVDGLGQRGDVTWLQGEEVESKTEVVEKQAG